MLGCLYCYFGTLGGPEDRSAGSSRPGELSHVGQNDLSLEEIQTFIATMERGLVHRVFVAGGEPLVWRGILPMLKALKERGVEIIVCSNGLPLQRSALCHALLDLPIDAISLSLDSHNALYNDTWRPDRSGQGWAGVVRGIQTMVRLRDEHHIRTKIGVYSVLTQKNLDHALPTGQFVAQLGVDYFVVQPVSLTKGHQLYSALSLDARHHDTFEHIIAELRQAHQNLYLPHPTYVSRVLQTLSREPLPIIHGCFGGRDLFFIEPDGTVWDCPSMYKIEATLPESYYSIQNCSATQLFSPARRSRDTTCSLFTQDCVNMWQLMCFDTILYEGDTVDDHQLP
jgi:sulfatase maturation enzyme AslB (radical SAM superfamily)